MPSTSVAQRKLFAIAEHHPEQLNSKNKGLANLSHKTLHDFASTPEKGLPAHVADGKLGGRMASNTGWMQSERLADGKAPGKWMEGAFAKSGEKGHSLHASLHVPEDEKIPKYRVRAASHSGNPHVQKQAQAALNANRKYYGQK